ncbi:MAG: hypothetical protein NTY90_04480 [Candidatus Micrarchaeota archaeon]|nr:hypothetical protein [Candidatus Micrarchaeota archaeon]
MADGFEEIKKELPHVIVLCLLIIVLLVVVTKFKVIHCSQIPQWCDIYCGIMGRSRVAIISADAGIGNPVGLARVMQSQRYSILPEQFPASEMSYGLIKDYELVVLERFKNITVGQVNALKMYLNGGGAVLWIGDSASRLYLSEQDKAEARVLNESWASQNKTAGGLPYYEWLEKKVKDTQGFGDLSSYLRATYVGNKNSTAPLTLRIVAQDHMVSKGLKTEFLVPPSEFAAVSEQPATVTKIAVIKMGNAEYPAIFESNYAGKILYVAFPLEAMNSSSLMSNILDYLVTCSFS